MNEHVCVYVCPYSPLLSSSPLSFCVLLSFTAARVFGGRGLYYRLQTSMTTSRSQGLCRLHSTRRKTTQRNPTSPHLGGLDHLVVDPVAAVELLLVEVHGHRVQEHGALPALQGHLYV